MYTPAYTVMRHLPAHSYVCSTDVSHCAYLQICVSLYCRCCRRCCCCCTPRRKTSCRGDGDRSRLPSAAATVCHLWIIPTHQGQLQSQFVCTSFENQGPVSSFSKVKSCGRLEFRPVMMRFTQKLYPLSLTITFSLLSKNKRQNSCTFTLKSHTSEPQPYVLPLLVNTLLLS